MSDEGTEYRTAAGRERMLEDHERRVDRLEDRMTALEGKEANRDKRWDYALRAIIAIATAIISGIVVALTAGGGVHP
jgi:hypothetical protein